MLDWNLVSENSPYRPIRALQRGLRLLEALSELGWSTPGQLARHTGIDRTTTYRLLATLAEHGYVARRDEDGAVALSARLGLLAANLREEDLGTQAAAPHLLALTAEIVWPADFATFSAGEIVIRFSTHGSSAMSFHRAMVGKRRPLLRSALGQAILSALEPATLAQTCDALARSGGPDAADLSDTARVQRILATVRARGYAAAEGTVDPSVSAIALPVRAGPNRVVGAANVIFFRKVMTTAEAAERFLPRLRACVDRIEADLAGQTSAESGAPPAAPL